MSGFECLADLIINDDGVSACDAGYVCFLCKADIAARRGNSSGELPFAMAADDHIDVHVAAALARRASAASK